MNNAVEQFLKYLVTEKECTENTIAAYRNDLTQFSRFIEEHTLPGSVQIQAWTEISGSYIQEYLFFLKEREYASSTVARKIAAVKSFFQFMEQAGLVASDPSANLESPKVKKQLPRPIGPEEIERLLAAPGTGGSAKTLRDKALLEVLYAAGMRVTELVNLNLEDVALTAKTVRCGSGGKRSRIVPIYPKAVQALRRYLKNGRESLLTDPEEVALFLNHRGQRLTRQGLWLIIKRYVELVGIEESVTPHTLRHSFAAHLLNSGAGLREVQERLGHANLSTTQVYRQISDENAGELTIDGKDEDAGEEPGAV